MPLHLLSKPLEIVSDGTGFRNIRVDRIGELFGVDRWQVAGAMPLRRDSRITLEVGDVIELQYPRWGWDAGKRFVLVVIEPRPADGVINFVMWG